MVECKEILKGYVYTAVGDVSLTYPLLGERVTQVSHVKQIFTLRLHGKASIASAEVPGAWVKGVGALLCPVVFGKGFRHSAFLCVPSRDGKLPCSPNLTLANALAVD